MNISTLEAIALALLLAGAVAYLAAPRRSRALTRRLAGREEIDIESQIAGRYRSQNIDPDRAADLWRSIADCYAVPAGKLRPDDRFAQELNTKRLFTVDDENSSVNLLISHQIAALGFAVEISQLHTLDDCIRALCRRN